MAKLPTLLGAAGKVKELLPKNKKGWVHSAADSGISAQSSGAIIHPRVFATADSHISSISVASAFSVASSPALSSAIQDLALANSAASSATDSILSAIVDLNQQLATGSGISVVSSASAPNICVHSAAASTISIAAPAGQPVPLAASMIRTQKAMPVRVVPVGLCTSSSTLLTGVHVDRRIP